MKEDIKTIKSSDELNNGEGKKIETTKLKVKIKEMYKIINFLTYLKCSKLVLKHLLKNVSIQ